jgi:hypothetical protein
MSNRAKMNVQVIASCCGLAYAVVFGLCWYGLAHFYAPASASFSPAQLGAFYAQHRQGIILGCTLTCIAAALHIPWTAQLGLMMARIEGSMPVLAVSQIMGGALTVAVLSFPLAIWVASAYRPDADPHVIQAMNDMAWMTFDLTWALTSVQMIAAGVVGLVDRSEFPLFPRWACYLAFGGAIGFIGITGIAFFKSGLFAWDGLFAFWVPFLLWVAWFTIFSFYMIADIRRRFHAEHDMPVVELPHRVHARA